MNVGVIAMFGRSSPRQVGGKPISARTLNRAAEAGDEAKRLRVGFGLSQKLVAGIPLIWLSFDLNVLKLARTDGSPPGAATGTTTAVPGSGTVTIFDSRIGLPKKTNRTVKAYNLAPTACGPNKWVVVVRIDGDWYVIWEACP
jgi:hypothetical protein